LVGGGLNSVHEPVDDPLRVRWLGRVPYLEALAVQQALFRQGSGQHLLLLEHPHVFTYGRGADLASNLLVEPSQVGAELVSVNRGGDITYHGPGQLVGYPILNVGSKGGPAGPADTVAYVCSVEQLVIDTLADLGVDGAGRLAGYPGVWLDPHGARPRKICAIGVRVSRGRTMHGFALNVTTDMEYLRRHIVPCGISDKAVASLAEEGVEATVESVAALVARRAADRWVGGVMERQDVAHVHRPADLSAFSRGSGPGQPVRMLGRLAQAGVGKGMDIDHRKPDWMRPKVHHGSEVLALRKSLGDRGLVTVCQEAGCPNLSECWSQGTATFMVLGERCTRACGFCLIDTRRPGPPSPDEPQRVAAAVAEMQLDHAVLTMVARDDLPDGGMGHVAACVAAIRRTSPSTTVETLISDAKGDSAALARVFDERPDVLNHNLETVARLQRAVRPSAGYARSLSVLAHSKQEGLVTKSGLMVGLGETPEEVEGALADLAGIGVDIVTIGQYLRPTTHHLPVARWVHPHEFTAWAARGRSLGIGHVEASPLTRSSYHAHEAVTQVSLNRSLPTGGVRA
jgi:lipoyl synthase